jgi:hypothetical protein
MEHDPPLSQHRTYVKTIVRCSSLCTSLVWAMQGHVVFEFSNRGSGDSCVELACVSLARKNDEKLRG